MGSDDRGQEYPCVCGKVFRRQLALERHVDVHHSSTPVSHTCEVCCKTFGSRNTLTRHRAIHENSTAKLGPPLCLEADSSAIPPVDSETTPECDLDLSDSIHRFNETDSLNLRVHFSPYQEEKEEEREKEEGPVMRTCKSIETRATGSLTCRTDQLSEDEITTSSISSATDFFVTESAHNNIERDQLSSGIIPKSAIVIFQNPSLSSIGFGANDEADQSMDFSDMVAEEIVSEPRFQTSDQLFPRIHATLHLSKSGQYPNLTATNDPTSTDGLEAKCQNFDIVEIPEISELTNAHSSQSFQKRINMVIPETRTFQETSRQSRGSEEERVDVEVLDEFEVGSDQKEPITLSTTRHLHGNRAAFICGICHKNFDSEKYLSMHMPLHKPYLDPSAADIKMIPVTTTSPDVPEVNPLQGQSGAKQKKTIPTTEMHHWTCQYCNKLFTQNSNYKNHMRTHSDERPFVCEICNIGFKERYHLKKHVLFKHTTDLKEKCRVCGKCFKDSTAVRAHERIHSEIRPYSCPLCLKTFKTSECLWHHENRSKTCGKSAMRLLDAALPNPQALVVLPNGSDFAPMRRTRKPRQGEGVSKLRTPRRPPMTSALNGTCAREQYSDLLDDRMISELEASVIAIKAEPDCDLFDSSLPTYFTSDQELENILDFFDSDANKEGSYADETGSDLTDSDNGLVAKDSEDFSVKYKSLECGKCAKKFSSTVTFEKHMVMHNEERPYRCTLCDNGFKLKVHLKKHHLYRHSNEYPCECSICGKRFKDSSAVRLHEKIHSSDRPFRCHCGKGFKTRENLWGHRNRGPCEKTQDFITNNISLFRTTEFGPILGVPITNGQGLIAASSNLEVTPIMSSSFGNSRATDVNQVHGHTNMQPVFLKTSHVSINVPHCMQFVPSCVVSRVATLKVIKPHSTDTLTQQTAVLPTAIVTPLLRDGTTLSASTHLSLQPHGKNTLKTVALNNLVSKDIYQLQSNITSADSRVDLLSHRTTSNASGPTVTVTGKLAKTVTDTVRFLSAGEKCPTVQKILEIGSKTNNKPLGINQLLGNPMVLDTINNITPKRRKLNSIGDDNSSTEGEDKPCRSRHGDGTSILCADAIGLVSQESPDSRALSYVDPLLTNSPRSSSHLSIYHGMDDYDDIKYDPNDPTLNIGDVYWGDSDNTLSSGWILENESLLCDLSLTSTFGTL